MTLAPKPNILMSPPDLHPEMELLMRVVPMPSDANGNGDIFGGWIMAQVDLAGSILPGIVSRGRIATVAVNQFTFKQAVSVGDVVSLYGRVEKIGRTSITVHMEVWAERNPSQPQLFKVTEANITYVAIDLEGGSGPNGIYIDEADWKFIKPRESAKVEVPKQQETAEPA